MKFRYQLKQFIDTIKISAKPMSWAGMKIYF